MERLWNAQYLKVMAANFMLYFAFYLLTPLLPIYLNSEFGATKDIIGMVLSGYTITALLTRPFSGYVVDHFNRQHVLMLCMAAFAVLFAGYIAATSLTLFAIIRTIHGGPFGAVTVANSTVMIDVLPSSRRNEGIGYYGLSNNLAMAIAPTIGITLYHQLNDFHLLFWIALCVATCGLACASWIRVKPKHTPPSTMPEMLPKMRLDRFFLTRAWMLAINIAFFGFCFGVLSNYLAIYGKEVLGRTNGTGTYFTLLSLGLILSRLQGGKGLREGKLTNHAAHGMIISLIGYLLFVAGTGDLAYYASAMLIGLGNGHMYPAFLNMFVAVARHNERGTANSSILTAWDLGFGMGILVGGIAAELAGYSVAFWIVAGMNATGVALFYLRTRSFFSRQRLDQ